MSSILNNVSCSDSSQVIGSLDSPIGYVDIYQSSTLPGISDEVSGKFLLLIIVALFSYIMLVVLLGFINGRRLTNPVKKLIASAVRMSKGDLTVRANTKVRDEIGELGTQFNAMAEKLELTVKDLKQERDVLRRFVADASHELRTPVTALKTFSEILLNSEGSADQKSSPDKRIGFLKDIEHQIERIEWIVTNLLNLSRLEAGFQISEIISISLNNLIVELLERFKQRAITLGITIRTDINVGNSEIKVDPVAVNIALDNILSNAMRHGGSGGLIKLLVYCENQTVVINIQDFGIGISEAELLKVYERFFRGRLAKSSGSGLGLSIARAAVVSNGGTILAKNNHGSAGVTFTVIFPLLRE